MVVAQEPFIQLQRLLVERFRVAVAALQVKERNDCGMLLAGPFNGQGKRYGNGGIMGHCILSASAQKLISLVLEQLQVRRC